MWPLPNGSFNSELQPSHLDLPTDLPSTTPPQLEHASRAPNEVVLTQLNACYSSTRRWSQVSLGVPSVRLRHIERPPQERTRDSHFTNPQESRKRRRCKPMLLLDEHSTLNVEQPLRLRLPNTDEPFRILSKRKESVTCTCALYGDTLLQIHDSSSRGLPESGDEVITSTSQVIRPHRSRAAWRVHESPILRAHLNSHPSMPSYDGTINRLPFMSATSEPLLQTNIELNTPSVTTNSSIMNTTASISVFSGYQSSFRPVTPENEKVKCSSSSSDTNSSDKYMEATNHERLEDLCGAPDPLPLKSYRLCSLTVPSLPVASANDRLIAIRLIRHARHNKTPDEELMQCPDCLLLPLLPVTGLCGHTRCTKCIQDHGSCPCGHQEPRDLHVNTIVQDLVRKMHAKKTIKRHRLVANVSDVKRRGALERGTLGHASLTQISSGGKRIRLGRHSRGIRPSQDPPPPPGMFDAPSRSPMSPQNRLDLARSLLLSGRYLDAAPHLARVAAANGPSAKLATNLLAQSISALTKESDPRRLVRELFRSVRQQSASSWLKPTDLECVLCYHTYTEPVTTPCGHTYCRTCIERSMDYRKSCALCLRSLTDFNLSVTEETTFISAALASIDALNPRLPPDPDVIPIFVCTVAYPTIPCPLFIFDPRYWLMIRRILESGSRKFGMVAYERDRSYSDYGTVLEVCDCVHLEDGRSILSTVGVSRFKIIERDVREGCDVARIQPLTDITPTEDIAIWDIRLMATQISYKALIWLNSMNVSVRSEIEAAFGQLPTFDRMESDWWETSDGPAWLWWLIAILPLRSEIKILILSTKSLLKRMMAVSRTLEAIDQVAMTTNTTSKCELRSALNNAEEWVQRSA